MKYSRRKNLRVLLIVVLMSHLSPFVTSHPYEDWEAVESVMHQWASGLMSGDITITDATLSKPLIAQKELASEVYGYPAELLRGNVSIVFREATHQIVDDSIRVSPIIFEALNGTGVKRALSLLFSKENDMWKITSIDIEEIPVSITSTNLSEQFLTVPVSFKLGEENTGFPVSARVRIVDDKGEYWPPQGHQKNITIGWRENVGGDVQIENKTYAYVKPEFMADLPAGKYCIRAEKGMEYSPENACFEVAISEENSVELLLKRWTNMESQSWYSGDTHTHFLNDYSALLEAQAEDLNVINVLATKWGELITNANEVTGAPSLVSQPQNIVFFNQETRHGFLGHTIFHPIKTLIYPLTWGGPGEGVAGGYDYPPMAHQADKAHAQGGIVTWVHFGYRMEAPIDVALGKIDSLDLFTWGDAFAASTTAVDGERVPGPVDYWYKFLNTGFRLPVTAGTDKMVNTQVVGSVRTYAHIEDQKFTYAAWIDAIRHGRTFVTTGPMISLTANGENIGSQLKLKAGDVVRLQTTAMAPYSRYPIERFELVQNGKVVATQLNKSKTDNLKITADIRIEKGAWFAARAYGPKILPYNTWPAAGSWAKGSPVMAHTSPIYVDVPGTTIWSKEDAEFLANRCDAVISWARTKAKFHTDAQRTEVVELFERAKAVYTPKNH